METIAAAALIAVGLVAAATVFARLGGRAGHGVNGRAPDTTGAATPASNGAVHDPDLPDRIAALSMRESAVAQREQTLSNRETELDGTRHVLDGQRQELTRELERVAGISVTRAKELLLKDVEDQARHDAARRIRQIEE
jgi:ribonuclease Y